MISLWIIVIALAFAIWIDFRNEYEAIGKWLVNLFKKDKGDNE